MTVRARRAGAPVVARDSDDRELVATILQRPAGEIRLRGNGPSAIVEIDVDDDTILCDQYGTLTTAGGLVRWLATTLGVNGARLTKDQAVGFAAAIHRLAIVTPASTTGDLGRRLLRGFLDHAPFERFQLHGDQADRYRAFALVDRCRSVIAAIVSDRSNPDRAAAIAEASLVLVDTATTTDGEVLDGERLIHCDHLFAYVKALGQVSYAAELARLVVAAGAYRSGKRGTIHATPIGVHSKELVLPFWRLPSGWEDDDE